MPGLTGLEMLRDLRRQDNYVTVIVLSGSTDPECVVRALKTGADDYCIESFCHLLSLFTDTVNAIEVEMTTSGLA